jgi:hypothetical protein
MARDKWQSISIATMNAPFDARSRPADLLPGAFRWKQNFAVNDTGKLSRPAGFRRLFSDQLYDDTTGDPCTPGATDNCAYTNSDFHDQDGARQKPTLLYESTAEDKTRRLFVATQSQVDFLDEGSGTWEQVVHGLGAPGSRFHCAPIKNTLVFTNDVDNVFGVNLADGSLVAIPELSNTVKLTKARVIASFYGFILLMNTFENGTRITCRVRWCDLNLVQKWVLSPGTGSLANYQDLDYGDEILNCALLGGNLMIYTARAIWKCYLNPAGLSASVDNPIPIFSFQKLYSNPENQVGCLAYPNSLVNTGDSHRYMARDGIYKFSPFVSQPEREEWIHASSAIIYSDRYPETQIDKSFCDEAIGCVRSIDPDVQEVHWSWPDLRAAGNNNHTLVCNVKYETCDYRDCGWTAMVNFSPNAPCNTVTVFVGSSGQDWCLKEIGGGIFYREYMAIPNGEPSWPATEPVYYAEGYDSILRGTAPLGYPKNEKTVRLVNVDHETAEQATPCKLLFKIGVSYHVADSNRMTGIGAPVWHEQPFRRLKYADLMASTELLAKNLRPDAGTEWPVYFIGRHIHYEFKITGDTGPAVGGDTAWNEIGFDSKVNSK